MATRNKSRIVMKENRVPLGKKREHLQKSDDLKLNVTQNASKLFRNGIKISTSTPLKTVNNDPPTNTLLNVIENPKTKLSTIKELELEHSLNISKITDDKSEGIKTMMNDIPISTKNKDNIKSTVLIEKLHETSNIDNLNNTVDEMKIAAVPDVVLSPFVCTTRGQKWKPSPRKPPKLSQLNDKYEDDNIADTYRKKLDHKTTELQNKVKYWTDLFTGNDINIPQSVMDEIDVVCGQTKLLTTDKFMQMSSLIGEFENKSGSMPITTGDLDGFWDMLLLQVDKLEGQFSQLAILQQNNWAPIEPIAKKVINKMLKVKKRPEVKSKFADFIKNQKPKEKKIPKSENLDKNDISDPSRFNEMKLSNNTCLVSSTPSCSDRKSFSPMLLKTMELSYVARRSGMSPILINKPHVSPLKPALKDFKLTKGIKRKNIHFQTPKKTPVEFVTPENSCNDVDLKKNVHNRVVTPHTIKTTKINNRLAHKNPVSSTNTTDIAEKNIKFKKNNVKPKAKEVVVKMDILTDEQNNDCTMRRSSRLANKPQKNYKC